MHQVFNHAGEEPLRHTAKAYGWELTGNLDPCVYCKTANAKQKDIPKTSETQSDVPGERTFMDIASIKTTTMGGAKFWLLLVDDATGMAWLKLLKKKSDAARELMAFMRQMKQHRSPVKCIRCDNAGENKDLHNECKESSDLTDVKFEFTARDSPQFNSKTERKFGVLFGRIRSACNAGKFDQEMKDKLWGKCAMTVTDVENLLVAKKQDKPAHEKFFAEVLAKAECMRQFGEMAVIKTSKKIKGKLEDRGLPCVYLGQARDHAGDTYRFLNPTDTIPSRFELEGKGKGARKGCTNDSCGSTNTNTNNPNSTIKPIKEYKEQWTTSLGCK
jgi:hypothetical protein